LKNIQGGKMKRNIKILLIVLFLSFFLTDSVLAARPMEATPGAWREKVKEKIEQRKEEVRLKLNERSRNRVQNIYGRVRNRLEKRIQRLEKLAERIEEKAVNRQQEGFQDVSIALAKVEETRGYLAQAEVDLQSADDKLAELLVAEEPKMQFSALKEELFTVRKSISSARQALVGSVKYLKPLKKEAENED
jgi:hypothetical protein